MAQPPRTQRNLLKEVIVIKSLEFVTDKTPKFKFGDKRTYIKLKAYNNGDEVSFANYDKPVIKIRNSSDYLLSIKPKIGDFYTNVLSFTSDDLKDLPPDNYYLELWVNDNAIYPSDGFLSFTIVKNITDITGETVSTITLHYFEERIDDLEQDLRAKADNGDFDGEKGEPGDKGDPGKDATNNDPNAVHVSGNQTISGVKNFIDTPTINGNKVLDDSLQIGGRNLLPNSSLESNFGGGWSYTDMKNLSQKNGFIFIEKPEATSDRQFLYYRVDDMDSYEIGQEYTFAIDFHTSTLDVDGGSVQSFVRMIDSKGATIKDAMIDAIDPNKCRNGYTRFSGTDVIPKGTVKMQATLAISNVIVGSFWVRHAQLEKGSMATDFKFHTGEIGTSQPIMSGNYGLRVTAEGFQKTTDGGATWTTANI